MTDGMIDTLGIAASAGCACMVCEGGCRALLASVQARDHLRGADCAAMIIDLRHRLSSVDAHAHRMHHGRVPDDPHERALCWLASPQGTDPSRLLRRTDVTVSGQCLGMDQRDPRNGHRPDATTRRGDGTAGWLHEQRIQAVEGAIRAPGARAA